MRLLLRQTKNGHFHIWQKRYRELRENTHIWALPLLQLTMRQPHGCPGHQKNDRNIGCRNANNHPFLNTHTFDHAFTFNGQQQQLSRKESHQFCPRKTLRSKHIVKYRKGHAIRMRLLTNPQKYFFLKH